MVLLDPLVRDLKLCFFNLAANYNFENEIWTGKWYQEYGSKELALKLVSKKSHWGYFWAHDNL